MVALARERGVIRGRKMRVDTTVVESNIHYPTDSGLLDDGARVLTRMMKKIEGKVGGPKQKVRERKRRVQKRVIAIAHALRHKGEEGELRRQREYEQLPRLTGRILGDTRRVLREVAGLPPRRRSGARELCERLETMAERVGRVVRQTKARIFEGLTQLPGKLVSLFEPQTEIIRKGKAGKPNEFGKLVLVQEAENQMVRWSRTMRCSRSDRVDRHLLQLAVEVQRRKLGRVPQLVTADAGFYSQVQEEGVQALGVKHVSVPNRSTRSAVTPTGKATLVQAGTEMAHWMRRTH